MGPDHHTHLETAMKKLFVLMCLVAVTGCHKRDREAEAATPDPTPRSSRAAKETTTKVLPFKTPWESGIRTDASSLFIEYHGNSVRGDTKYKGKNMSLVGVVKSVKTDVLGRPTLFLAAGESPLDQVVCYLKKGDTASVADISPNNSVAVVGECTGYKLHTVTVEKTAVVKVFGTADELIAWTRSN